MAPQEEAAPVGPVALVTDSTAALTSSEARDLRVSVVPLHVVVDDEEFTEGVDISPQEVIEALRKGRRVSTSRPSPAAMLACYEALADAGATAIVSAHLSAQLSGTCDAAHLAAREAPVPVRVVDSGSTGLGLGFAVETAARELREPEAFGDGRSAPELADAVGAALARRTRNSTVLCYVHSLDCLRRGGRIGAAASFLGGALAIKPIIALAGGHVEPVEKLRTSGRALARLAQLAGEAVAAGGPGTRVAIQHADALDYAENLAADLVEAADSELPVQIRELPAVLSVHLGPGTVAAVIAPA
ncbi:DegV family protein with EDD domain [Kineosphaera limosa]|nr:DegV family protein [Kineosphaera limosa]NYE02877.1 DegV family protein with EDD domain [Kineosphaera limosa]